MASRPLAHITGGGFPDRHSARAADRTILPNSTLPAIDVPPVFSWLAGPVVCGLKK